MTRTSFLQSAYNKSQTLNFPYNLFCFCSRDIPRGTDVRSSCWSPNAMTDAMTNAMTDVMKFNGERIIQLIAGNFPVSEAL